MSAVRQISSWNHDFTQIAKESGFHFRSQSYSASNGFFDWKEIDCIDVDTIITDRDCNAIDRLLPHLLEAPIGTLVHNRILDPNIRKYLQLTQLGLQYLLFCKKFLDKTVTGLQTAIDEVSKDNSKLGRLLKRKNEEIVALQKRIENLDKNQQNEFPCGICVRTFKTYRQVCDHMILHFEKENDIPKKEVAKPITDNSLINTIKLELEVKQLKERLNVAEKELQDQKYSKNESNEKFSAHEKVIQTKNRAIETTKFVEVSVQASEDHSPNENKENIVEQAKEESVSVLKLKDILSEQAKTFEMYQETERKAYRNEITDLQLGFKEAFKDLQLMINEKLKEERKQKEHHVIPAITVVKEVETSQKVKPKPKPENQIEKETKAVEVPKVPAIDKILKEEHDHWENRFKNLEKIFERNQAIMSNSLQNLTEAYSEKFNTLERSIRDVTFAKKNAMDENFSNRKMVEALPEIGNKPNSPTAKVATTSSDDLDKPMIDKKRNSLIQTSDFNEVDFPVKNSIFNAKTISVENIAENECFKKGMEAYDVKSLDSHKTEPDESTNKPNKVDFNNGMIKKLVAKPNATNEKRRSSKTVEKQELPDIKTNQNNEKEQHNIFGAFKRKLSKYSTKNEKKILSTPQMLAMKSQIAQERVENKKSNNLFATIRTKLSTKVDKEIEGRQEKIKIKDNGVLPRWSYPNQSTIEEESESTVSGSESEYEIEDEIEHEESEHAEIETDIKKDDNSVRSIDGSAFNESRSPLSSTKIEEQLKRVLESPIRRPSLPAKILLNSSPHFMKPQLNNHKKILFSNQLENILKGPNDKNSVPIKSKQRNASHLTIKNISDD